MTEGSHASAETVSHLPLAPRDFQVLLLLFDEPMHGYGIVKASEEGPRGSALDLGSLYRIIARLTREGLLEDVTDDLDDDRRQRRYYRATELGRRVARAEATRLWALLESERAELLWEKP
jgi:DNA-binding PadR family transcriptional regulator